MAEGNDTRDSLTRIYDVAVRALDSVYRRARESQQAVRRSLTSLWRHFDLGTSIPDEPHPYGTEWIINDEKLWDRLEGAVLIEAYKQFAPTIDRLREEQQSLKRDHEAARERRDQHHKACWDCCKQIVDMLDAHSDIG
jgi:hypothetical protein